MPNQILGDLPNTTRVVLFGRFFNSDIEVRSNPPSANEPIITFSATLLYKEGESLVLLGWRDGERSTGHSFKIANELKELQQNGHGGTDTYQAFSSAFFLGFTQAVWARSDTIIYSLVGEFLPVHSRPIHDASDVDDAITFARQAAEISQQINPPAKQVVQDVICKYAYYGIDCNCGGPKCKRR